MSGTDLQHPSSDQEMPVPEHMIHHGDQHPAANRISETTEEEVVPVPDHMIHTEDG